MGRLKKAAKGALAVSTLGASVAAEKAISAGADAYSARRSEDGASEVAEEATIQPPTAPDATEPAPLFVGMSHEDGRNATVSLYGDRIERVKQRSRMSASKAHQDVEVTAIKSVSSVQAKKDGVRFTAVTVYASGNNIEFKFGHAEAKAFTDAIMALILGAGQPPPSSPESGTVDVVDQIKKLADLRDGGALTDDEFNAKKTQLLERI